MSTRTPGTLEALLDRDAIRDCLPWRDPRNNLPGERRERTR